MHFSVLKQQMEKKKEGKNNDEGKGVVESRSANDRHCFLNAVENDNLQATKVRLDDELDAGQPYGPNTHHPNPRVLTMVMMISLSQQLTESTLTRSNNYISKKKKTPRLTSLVIRPRLP